MKKQLYIRTVFYSVAISILLIGCQQEQQSQKVTNSQSQLSSEKVQKSLTLPQKVLQKYDEGEAVEQLQEGLKKLGYSINVTGLYDEQTTNAIRIYSYKKIGNYGGV